MKVEIGYQDIRRAVIADIEQWAAGMKVSDIKFTRLNRSGGEVYAVAILKPAEDAGDERTGA